MKDYSTTSMVELATLISKHLAQKEIKVVLVGGLAVEIYTENLYLTKDIDMVNYTYNSPNELSAAMAEIGFQKHGRLFINETTAISVEFPSGPLSVGDELIQNMTMVETDYGELPILFALDVVKDRLAAYFHWRDRQSLAQALTVMHVHSISPSKIKAFCTREAEAEQFELVNKLYRQVRKGKLTTMMEVEGLIVKEAMKHL